MKLLITFSVLALLAAVLPAGASPPQFEGKHFRGSGDLPYLQLLETSRGMFDPNPQLQYLAMAYDPLWNGFVEGPTWNAWWIQNSYGTTYAALPFLQEPYLTFLQNSQDLWFNQMGDGRRVGSPPPFNWVAPDGCLCDAALPGRIIYKQGDGRIQIHDWAVEFTAAGILLQSELLLISRDRAAIAHYLPLLERSAAFIEARRDPRNNLFLAGPAANLLAPSYAGYHRPDGSYGMAYLTGISVTFIAALDRLIEVEKLGGHPEKAAVYSRWRGDAREGLPLLTTADGYFIKSLDPDGTKHGVYGASHYGYFESSPNHDAIAFRVVDTAQAAKIYRKMASIPGLRPYDLIIANYPSLDDMYEKPEGLWGFGEWVNGGHWTTCEARMILAYYRLGKYADARRSLERILTFAREFRLDNPLTHFGSQVYQPQQPINLTYDAFGAPAAFLRGLFEYLYRADSLTLVPHIPPGITDFQQIDPVRFGKKRVYLSTVGRGPVTAVRINGRPWKLFDQRSVTLPYDRTPVEAHILIALGGAAPRDRLSPRPHSVAAAPAAPADLAARAAILEEFSRRMAEAGMGGRYEAAHARLVLACMAADSERQEMLRSGKIVPLPAASETAADLSYHDAAVRLADGLEKVIQSYRTSQDRKLRQIAMIWDGISQPPNQSAPPHP